MTHEDYMKQAIELAAESERQGGMPIGAVVVNAEGDVVGTGISLVAINNDPTGHSEIIAIRAAAEKLQTYNLAGCRLYSTCESCGMCLSAMAWANMTDAFHGVSAAEIASNPYELKQYDAAAYAAQTQTWDGAPVRVTGGILRSRCKSLLANYKNWRKIA